MALGAFAAAATRRIAAAAAGGSSSRSMTSTAEQAVKNVVEPAVLSKSKDGGMSLWTYMATTNLRLLFHLPPFVGLLAWYTAEGLDYYQEWAAIEQPPRRR